MFFHSIKAQSNTLNNINSSNVLDYYQQTETLKYQSIYSVDILSQIGNGNIAETVDKTPKYLNLLQNGNYNTTYFVNPNNYPTNADIRINGSGNYIDILGSNSISDGMKININASDMTIFMRNY
jgi:hypothetical protein